MHCTFCHSSLTAKAKVGFREACSQCGHDLHICKNCFFYDERSYNACAESLADRVIDKEKFNFCEYFKPRENNLASSPSTVLDPAAEAKRKLAELFKK